MFTCLFSEECIRDQLEFWLVSRWGWVGCLRSLLILWQVAVELRVKLVPDLPGEAKLAELRKNCPQEILQVHSQVVLSDLQQHWLGLPEVTAG